MRKKVTRVQVPRKASLCLADLLVTTDSAGSIEEQQPQSAALRTAFVVAERSDCDIVEPVAVKVGDVRRYPAK